MWLQEHLQHQQMSFCLLLPHLPDAECYYQTRLALWLHLRLLLHQQSQTAQQEVRLRLHLDRYQAAVFAHQQLLLHTATQNLHPLRLLTVISQVAQALTHQALVEHVVLNPRHSLQEILAQSSHQ